MSRRSTSPDPAQELTAPIPRPQPPGPGPHEPEADLETIAEGRYLLARTLGAGGMGIVRQARDRLLDRDVAVKLLADNLAVDPDARERFLREARAAARIVHPNVVAVHDAASDGDRPYLVMELVDGPSLANVLAAGGPLPVGDVVEVAVDTLAGVERAQRMGVLHRDLKPGNLLRGSDRTVKVTDFGVAEAADVPGFTRTGTVVGTVGYLAPERRRGEAATVASDLFALGVTLAELVTGEVPEPDAPPVLSADAPAGLRRLLASLLASDPDRRPADATEALERLASDRLAPRRRALPLGGPEDEPPVRSPLAPPEQDLGVAGEGEPHPRSALFTPHTSPATPRPSTSRFPTSRALSSRLSGGRLAVVATVMVAVLALTVARVASTDETGGDGAGTDVERVPGDPATTARNLAEWLRRQQSD